MFSGALAWNSLGTSCANTHLHSFLIRLAAFLVIFFGNSIMSMPLRMMLYVFMGSGPEKGGLQNIRQTHQLSLKCICGHCVVKTSAQLAFINHLRNLFSFTHTHTVGRLSTFVFADSANTEFNSEMRMSFSEHVWTCVYLPVKSSNMRIPRDQ